jgi:hypothetical protein
MTRAASFASASKMPRGRLPASGSRGTSRVVDTHAWLFAVTIVALGAVAKPALALEKDAASRDASVDHAASRDAEDGPPHRVRGGLHVEVLARDLRLSDVRAARLEAIATRYFEATKRRLVITGGTRSADRQARLILAKLDHGDDVEKLYENKHAIGEILANYRHAKAVHMKRMSLERTTRDLIEAQMKRGVFVSRHLKSGAADVRSRGMTPAQIAALRAAVAGEPGVALLDERGGPEPHFHLSL